MDPKWTRIIAISVVAVVVVAGVGVYLYNRHVQSSGSCALKSTNPLVVDQAEKVVTVDPDSAASTPEWGLVQQVYQTLIMYNGTNYTTYTGVLAKNWTTSPDRLHWNFTLRYGVHFSNGDPFNAYVMWFSLYRTLALQGIDQYLLSENFWYPNVNYYSPPGRNTAAVTTLLAFLNNSANFATPSASALAYMSGSGQSFRALDNHTIQVNLGYGYNDYLPKPIAYTYLLAELATPGAAAVDPLYIDQHGGVTPGISQWMSSNAMGTGQYALTTFDPISGYTLSVDPNYWGKAAAPQEPWNNNLQPARAGIQVNFQTNAAVNVQDLTSRAVATASFAYLGPDTVHQLQGTSCVVVQNTAPVFSGASGSWWVYMNQTVPPFNNFSVREAVIHSIDYQTIINRAFGGFAFEWVGPVPPGSPYYNPGNLPPYTYDPTLAHQEMLNSPWPSGYSATFSFMYLNTGPDWVLAADLLQSELAVIGIKINPIAVSLDTFYAEQTIDPATGQCTSMESTQGGPFPIGLDFYASDYISPDDWTQENVLSYGSANVCMSGYYNPAMDNLVLTAAGDANPANLTADYTKMTLTMYDNYTNAWLAVPDLFLVYNPTLSGLFSNPMGSTELATMEWNTVYAA